MLVNVCVCRVGSFTPVASAATNRHPCFACTCLYDVACGPTLCPQLVVIEGVCIVELVVPAASSVDEETMMTPPALDWGASSDGRDRFDSRDEFNSRDSVGEGFLVMGGAAADEGERERAPKPKPVVKPHVVGMYPSSFQKGASVPEFIQLFCFPDSDVLVNKVTETPLASVSPPSTG